MYYSNSAAVLGELLSISLALLLFRIVLLAAPALLSGTSSCIRRFACGLDGRYSQALLRLELLRRDCGACFILRVGLVQSRERSRRGRCPSQRTVLSSMTSRPFPCLLTRPRLPD